MNNLLGKQVEILLDEISSQLAIAGYHVSLKSQKSLCCFSNAHYQSVIG